MGLSMSDDLSARYLLMYEDRLIKQYGLKCDIEPPACIGYQCRFFRGRSMDGMEGSKGQCLIYGQDTLIELKK